MMGTSYPPGVDGMAIMRDTAAAIQQALNELIMAGCVATALDDDMLEIRISGMHARALLLILSERGIIEFPRIGLTAESGE